jgi:hypothetical protein
VPISLSSLADQVAGYTAALAPLFKRLEAHVLRAERHGDDTTVPVLAKGKTDTGRIWVYVRDDKPFGGPEPPGASRDRRASIPRASGQLQRDLPSRRLQRLWEALRAQPRAWRDPGRSLLAQPQPVCRSTSLSRK